MFALLVFSQEAAVHPLPLTSTSLIESGLLELHSRPEEEVRSLIGSPFKALLQLAAVSMSYIQMTNSSRRVRYMRRTSCSQILILKQSSLISFQLQDTEMELARSISKHSSKKQHTASQLPEQSKEPRFLFSLREFEASLVARFLPPRVKLLILALLSKQWKRLISKHYAWTSFPKLNPHASVVDREDFLKFQLSFTELSGIQMSELPLQLLRMEKMKYIGGASSIGGVSLEGQEKLLFLASQMQILSKVRELAICCRGFKSLSPFDSALFWEKLAHLSKLQISLDYFRFYFDLHLKDGPLHITLKPLVSLKELKLELKVGQSVRRHTPKPILALADFPPSLERIHFSEGGIQFSPEQIASLPSLGFLHFGEGVDSRQVNKCVSSFCCLRELSLKELTWFLKSALSKVLFLEIKVMKENLGYFSIPGLESITIHSLTGLLSLKGMPFLRLLSLNKQRILLEKGIDKERTFSPGAMQLEGLEYRLELDKRELNEDNTRLTANYVEGLNLSVGAQAATDHLVIETQWEQHTFQFVRIEHPTSKITVKHPSLRDLQIYRPAQQPAPPISAVLLSPSLAYVHLNVAKASLHLSFENEIQILKVVCSSLTLEDTGKVHSLSLRIRSLKASVGSSLFSSVKQLYLIEEGEAGKTKHVFDSEPAWPLLSRLTLAVMVYQKTLLSIQRKAPSLRQIVLEGDIMSKKQRKAIIVDYSRWLRLVDAKGLWASEVQLVRGENSKRLFVQSKESSSIKIKWVERKTAFLYSK